MKTTVTELLREFPKIRRAAFAGERVVIETRQGNLILIAERATGDGLFGCMKGRAIDHGLSEHTRSRARWKPSL